MKKALLILLAIVLVAGINDLKAQDQKEKKKIEKNVNVEKNNGETTVTITESEGDKTTKKVLTGEEAEEYLENQKSESSYFFSEDMDEGGNKVIVMEIEEGSGENFVWVSDNEMEMDFDFGELEEELEALREELDDLNKEEIALRLDEIIEMKKEIQKVHIIEMEQLHHEMGELHEIMEMENVNVTVVEEDGVMIITKTIGDTKTVEEIKIDGDNKRKQVYVISSTEGKHEGHATSDNLTMNVYPNPSDGNFTIELELKKDDVATVKVLDLNGKEVYNRSVKGAEKHELNVKLKKPSPGAYVVIVEQGNTKMKLKTIIK